MGCICKICGTKSNYIFKALLLSKYDVMYHHCPKCDFIQSEEPYWLDEAYKNPINIEDTGLVSRNILLAKRTSTILYKFFNGKGIFLDYAAGYGLFVRLMRDYGFDFYWSDIHTENLLAKGFEYNPASHKYIEAITAFECFEHFPDPIKEIEKLLSVSSNIIFSTETFNRKIPAQNEWDYYGFTHGQHVSFYSQKTLRSIAQKFGLNFYSNGKSYHLLTKKKISGFIFNFLLKLSMFGSPLFVKCKLGSKRLTDFNKMKINRSNSE